jgi:hypothetical protein
MHVLAPQCLWISSTGGWLASSRIIGSLKMLRRPFVQTATTSASCVSRSVSWKLSTEPKSVLVMLFLDIKNAFNAMNHSGCPLPASRPARARAQPSQARARHGWALALERTVTVLHGAAAAAAGVSWTVMVPLAVTVAARPAGGPGGGPIGCTRAHDSVPAPAPADSNPWPWPRSRVQANLPVPRSSWAAAAGDQAAWPTVTDGPGPLAARPSDSLIRTWSPADRAPIIMMAAAAAIRAGSPWQARRAWPSSQSVANRLAGPNRRACQESRCSGLSRLTRRLPVPAA